MQNRNFISHCNMCYTGLFHPIPCDQCNGFGPGLLNDWGYGDQGNDGCNGRFVSHYWCESRNTVVTLNKIHEWLFKSIGMSELIRSIPSTVSLSSNL